MISYNSENVKMPKIRKRDTSAWIKQVAASYGRKVGEVGYLFVDIINGDLVISLDTVKSNAELFNKPYEEELFRVIIHGILHLCGINDKGPGEREIMEAAENKALEMAKSVNLLAK